MMDNRMKERGAMWFQFDGRLGIELPEFPVPYEELDPETQAQVVTKWERIRARIPDRILVFESEITTLLHEIENEDDWDEVVRRFYTISDLASRISDLNSWRRIDPHISQT
jgi:hypothetical protein